MPYEAQPIDAGTEKAKTDVYYEQLGEGIRDRKNGKPPKPGTETANNAYRRGYEELGT